jgi:hypothetical protein
MNFRLRNTVSQFILLAYILAGVLLEVGHRDVHSIVLDATPMLSSHECGATEVHVPLDKRHECLACSLSTLRVATAATVLSSNTPTPQCLSQVLFANQSMPDADVIYSGKRGPPVS